MRVAPPVLCVAVASLCLASPAAGVDRDRALTQLGIDVWHLRQGLPQGTVTAITQTRDGYLWLGTEEGLARFDGVRFAIFDRKNTPRCGSTTSSRCARHATDPSGSAPWEAA